MHGTPLDARFLHGAAEIERTARGVRPHRLPDPQLLMAEGRRPHTSTFDGLPAGDKLVELWLPHNEPVELVELRSDAPVAPVEASRRVWLHHGSSISHGSNASTPTQVWPAIAARLGDVDLRNLGLGGSALVDPFLARVIRDGHPTTPLVLASAIFCGIHEETPGPGAVDPDTLGTGLRGRAPRRPEPALSRRHHAVRRGRRSPEPAARRPAPGRRDPPADR